MASQSKSVFRNMCRDSEQLNAYEEDIGYPIVSNIAYRQYVRPRYVLIDALTRLRGVSDKDDMTSRNLLGLVGDMCNAFLAHPSVETVAVIFDKPWVPATKGVTQKSRQAAAVGMTTAARYGAVAVAQMQQTQQAPDLESMVPEGMSLEQAIEHGYVSAHMLRGEPPPPPDEARRKRIDAFYAYKQRCALQLQQSDDSKGRLTLLDTDLPDVALAIQPVAIDGLHAVEKALVAVADERLPGPWREVSGKHRARCMRYVTRGIILDPIAHVCPPPGKRIILDGHCMSRDHHVTAPPESLNAPRHSPDDNAVPLVLRHPDDRMSIGAQSCLGKGALADTYASVTSTPYPWVHHEPLFTNRMGETDWTLFFYIDTIVRSQPGCAHSFELVSVDTDVFALALMYLFEWEGGYLGQDLQALPLPTIYHTHAPGWRAPGDAGGAINVTNMYRRIVRHWLHNDSSRMLSLLCAVRCSASDYTLGYCGVPMNRFIQAFLAFQERHASDGTARAVPYLTRLAYVDDAYRVVVDPAIYRRMVKCAYYVAHEPKFRKLNIGHPHRLTLEQVRTTINYAVVPRTMLQYTTSPLANPDDDSKMKQLMRVLEKRLPPNSELDNRCALTHNIMHMEFQVGAASLDEANLADMGFEAADATRPLSRDNVRMRAAIDYEGRLVAWMASHGVTDATFMMDSIRV